jgi:hypothetical protein
LLTPPLSSSRPPSRASQTATVSNCTLLCESAAHAPILNQLHNTASKASPADRHVRCSRTCCERQIAYVLFSGTDARLAVVLDVNRCVLYCYMSATDPATLADLVAAASGLTRCAQQQAMLVSQPQHAAFAATAVHSARHHTGSTNTVCPFVFSRFTLHARLAYLCPSTGRSLRGTQHCTCCCILNYHFLIHAHLLLCSVFLQAQSMACVIHSTAHVLAGN